ncbi:putative flavoprotein CzcO associated with the cation diffusion facilitator CzcD [Geosmithia morbida]|uniref:Flavoprotein CzcO associated with the cation diffusion facilitator CzcD n=1 Tax=Geosmithia morbida TaxID=1094350 RepID=A0A9P4YRL0_9HYPO|nr:putative flavoprotein CzcO associated with the cation diffusion facilitator CzcD [Geosmithia morbida]KAF4120790.1 putative flavoprotein CzcO associated with the cation diffusion facilitator CzcD [Geosmithia morbida]
MAIGTQEPVDVDREKLRAIREKYDQEAAKRLRPDGSAQFVQLAGADEERLRFLAEDPWVDHESLNARESPINSNSVYKYFAVGAGYGGLQFAIRLIERGIATPDDIRLADAGGGFGGTWYWNRFPGLHCDVESYIYMPLLEETGYIPTKKYAPGEEIRLYAERIAARWGLSDKVLFRSNVRSIRWDDQVQLWTINVLQGRGPSAAPIEIEFRAEYVYLAAGVLTRPQIPSIPGLMSFSGPIFHTARWNYAVSGGSPSNQVLEGLRGKRVGVVGTAATSIAVVPEVAKYAGELFVIQRTQAYVKARGQHDTDPQEFRFLTNSARPGEENLIKDEWTTMPAYSALMGSPSHGIVDPAPDSIERLVEAFHIMDLPHMEAIRDRVDKLVKDPDTAAKLKPWYPSWCKRPTFSDAYLQAFNQPNVHLVDTDGKGPSRATDGGLVVGDKEYPLDIIIFGTGYNIAGRGSGSPATRTGVEIVGRNGRSLDDKWKEGGAATLHGYATNGFPNLFFSGTSQATVTGNNVWMLGLIAEHVTFIIAQAQRRVGPDRRAILEVTREAEEAHTAEVVRRAPFFSALAGCTPGYFNGHGDATLVTDPKEKQKRARNVVWSEGTVSFLEYIQKWRDEGSLKGVDIVPARD